jgi:hypothetical protein
MHHNVRMEGGREHPEIRLIGLEEAQLDIEHAREELHGRQWFHRGLPCSERIMLNKMEAAFRRYAPFLVGTSDPAGLTA